MTDLTAKLQEIKARCDAEPCAFDLSEPCEMCGIARRDHDSVQTHDYEPERNYRCAGCPDDVAWNSDNISEHPSYDHDFDAVPIHTRDDFHWLCERLAEMVEREKAALAIIASLDFMLDACDQYDRNHPKHDAIGLVGIDDVRSYTAKIRALQVTSESKGVEKK